ncbi:UNVERIFIED_ORG: hypothetical protein ABIC48_005025 [Burkholderia territorii]
MEIDFSRPRKPTVNAKNESCNGRFRKECLSAHGFVSLEDAARKIEVWCEHYDEAPSLYAAVDDTGGIRPPVFLSGRFGLPRRAGIFQLRPGRQSGRPQCRHFPVFKRDSFVSQGRG